MTVNVQRKILLVLGPRPGLYFLLSGMDSCCFCISVHGRIVLRACPSLYAFIDAIVFFGRLGVFTLSYVALCVQLFVIWRGSLCGIQSVASYNQLIKRNA